MSASMVPVRAPVKRQYAEYYILLSLISFAASVTLTRLFLELTGYPQIGNSELHIAHVLWGGLLLFIASLVPLIFANRWAYSLGAFLSGVGVGLFIDEVGKFITQSNDYFYPPAAPIIYAFFLLTVLLYLRVRKPEGHVPRSDLYHVLEDLTEVLDHDLEPPEHARMEGQLKEIIRESEDSNLKQLATALLDFLNNKSLQLADSPPEFFERVAAKLSKWRSKLMEHRRALKAILILGLFWVGALATIKAGTLLAVALVPGLTLEAWITDLIDAGNVESASEILWLLVRLALEGVVGAFALLSAIFLLAGKEKRGVATALVCLLLSLTTVNLLIFYLDQFNAVARTVLHFGLLVIARAYRRWHL